MRALRRIGLSAALMVAALAGGAAAQDGARVFTAIEIGAARSESSPRDPAPLTIIEQRTEGAH